MPATLLDPCSPVGALLAFALALATAAALLRCGGAGAGPAGGAGRVEALDGLRGLLAFAVFLHHASIWADYLATGAWATPRSRLYAHFGQSAVVLFFMVTGFLFFGRLLDGRRHGLDWTRLYLGRLLRLAPLYAVAVAALLAVVLATSGFALRVPPGRLAHDLLTWLAFGLAGMPDLNGVAGTPAALMGAAWTLRHEWLFYLALPLLALVAGHRPSPALLVASGAALYALDALRPTIHQLSFAGGMVAALLARWDAWRRWALRPSAALLSLATAATVVAAFDTAYAWLPVLLLAAAFAPLAAGNTLFGLLARPALRLLGEASYGLYLLHGLLLYTAFRLVGGWPSGTRLALWQHWAVVLACTPVLVVVAHAAWRWIERPALRPVARWSRAIGRLMAPQPGPEVSPARPR